MRAIHSLTIISFSFSFLFVKLTQDEKLRTEEGEINGKTQDFQKNYFVRRPRASWPLIVQSTFNWTSEKRPRCLAGQASRSTIIYLVLFHSASKNLDVCSRLTLNPVVDRGRRRDRSRQVFDCEKVYEKVYRDWKGATERVRKRERERGERQ